jgi:hypothetical protein
MRWQSRRVAAGVFMQGVALGIDSGIKRKRRDARRPA